MDRAVLLALLGIPLLVIIHVALFWQPLPSDMANLSAADNETSSLQGHWQSSERVLPSHFVIEHLSQRGS
jgi:hypothetical protein